MKEIRFHGRGGQGAQVAGKLLGRAAFLEGKYISAFPFFGVERRGAPVTAYTRIDDDPIRIKSAIYEPDYVAVLDPSLLKAVDVTAGLKPGGLLLINTSDTPSEARAAFAGKDMTIFTVDATDIAIENRLGSKMQPIVNTAICGALAAVSGLVTLDSIIEAIQTDAPIKKEENKKAARKAFENTLAE